MPTPEEVRRSKMRRLFDHLLGAKQEGLRDRQSDRFRRLEVDHQFKFGWLLDR
jgi:hypothetical protein